MVKNHIIQNNSSQQGQMMTTFQMAMVRNHISRFKKNPGMTLDGYILVQFPQKIQAMEKSLIGHMAHLTFN